LPCIKESKWNHILYVNNLPDTSFIKNINSGIISYDISVGKQIDVELLKYVDYLFISDEDMFTDFDSLCNLTKGWVILHHKTGSISSNKNNKIVINTEEIDNVNVLGAGDIYISHFIVNMLRNIQIKNSLQMAHDDTYKTLLERKV
jgi:sugar/nucleoside kinase (ribokinase family)